MPDTKESLVARQQVMHQNSLIRILLLAQSEQNAAKKPLPMPQTGTTRMNSKSSVSYYAILSQQSSGRSSKIGGTKVLY